ncbi:hypothetical protein INT45_013235 [Circinella minor]|uniref:Uncharacterized protein n=1 Tax=Circinella minor TaxID=1195481 RepID=A0A8H7RTY9_9FUNG|nr:hypothetical protein INT45_013235 [Circinella minor]
MTEYRTRHNLDVGVPNRTGKAYKSHYNIWLKDKTQLLYLKLDDALPDHWRDWRNSSACTSTTEVFDISMVTGEQIEDLWFYQLHQPPTINTPIPRLPSATVQNILHQQQHQTQEHSGAARKVPLLLPQPFPQEEIETAQHLLQQFISNNNNISTEYAAAVEEQ